MTLMCNEIAQMTMLEHSDIRIRRQLQELATDSGYWDFRGGAKRDALHGITQYPAMMVPAMQGKLLDVLCNVLGNQIRVVDPFIGSGTTLVESMRRGLDFWGQDVNPLAVLISLSKTGPFDVLELERAVERVYEAAKADHSSSITINFFGRDKWFSSHVLIDLARIRKAIQNEENLWVRRTLWVSLAETVRLTSNSRTSTFKLHVRSKDDLESRRVNAIEQFFMIAADTVERVRHECAVLAANNMIKSDNYIGTASVQIGRSDFSLPGSELFDLLVTSPPYGDGASTVPYGQYSYLPLQWIDMNDIIEDFDGTCLKSTHEIDSRALGGSRRDALIRIEKTTKESPALSRYLNALEAYPHERRSKVAAFFADFEKTLDTICKRMRPNSYMIWTVGNRRVSGVLQPLDEILTELLENRGGVLVDKLDRVIPSKRMASRNSVSLTMRQEQVLIMRMEG